MAESPATQGEAAPVAAAEEISEFESCPVGAYRMRRITNFLERRLTGPRSRSKKVRARRERLFARGDLRRCPAPPG